MMAGISDRATIRLYRRLLQTWAMGWLMLSVRHFREAIERMCEQSRPWETSTEGKAK
ncbi:hypothetical protein [Allorhodopirellula heiligendammensis]|uniref:Uncharacterized protein n=1 Tax=Allorhodopirellula heiligendammensis TaxID=2714739 RepID=A0A5C6BF83_9BACT|nr:hypothetical protein [Allorhodopirellula heiligendammensis]TWU09939.1 hypothetical protein Poly21_52670 [Allorhodopirellula heiligendammensis]